jgi:ABC-type branched-subunit amino acid transport system substrate-binding protein
MNKKIIWSIVAVVVVIILAVGVKKPSNNLTFGLIVGASGDYAAVGEAFAKGAELAQAEWNLANPDRQIVMVKEDDGFDAKKGLSAYKKLVSVDHIDGLLNMTTITIDALYNEVVSSGMPVALGFEQGIEAKNDNVVQLWPGSVPAEAKLGAYIKEKGFKNIVIFVDNGSAVFERFAGGFKKGYELPVQEIKIGSDSGDIRSSALKVTSIKPDAIVFIVKPTTGALLIKELKLLSQAKYQFVFDANIQTGFTDYTKVLGDTSILNGSILYTVPNVYRQEFNENFKKKFGQEPTIGSETGYNAFKLLAQSYDSNKTKWVKNMQEAHFVGADGNIVFDENGIRIPELKIGTIEGGKLPN